MTRRQVSFLRAVRCALATTLACSLAFAVAVFPMPNERSQAFADEAASAATRQSSAPRVVKVGYMDSPGNLSRTANGSLEGYTYDYLIRISQFTGWKYEFVEAPGETANEKAVALLNMLENGEADIVGGMTYTPALAELYEYPSNSYGTAHTALFVPDENPQVTQTNLTAKGEVSVAVLESAQLRRQELVYFCDKNNLKLTIVECANGKEIKQKVDSGEADAYLDIDINPCEGYAILETLTSRPYFFAAPKGQRAVIDEVDRTIERINQSNPTLQDDLYGQYFDKADIDFVLTETELAYAQQHETLRVGIISEKAPLQQFDKNTGQLSGVTASILDYLAKHTGLSFEIVPIDRSDNIAQAIRSANVDLVAGIDGSRRVSTDLGVSLTAPYMTTAMQLVYGRFVDPEDLSGKKAALPWDLASVMPGESSNSVLICDSLEDCLKAVNEGKADYTYGTTYITSYYTAVNGLDNLLWLPATTNSRMVETCFGLVQPIDPDLLVILNKSIRSLSTEQIDSIIYDNSLVDQDQQIGMFIKDHLLEFAVGCILLLALIIVLLGLYLRMRMKAARSIREENRRFQKLYALSNEEFFEYSIKNDTLTVSSSDTLLTAAGHAPEAAKDDEQRDSSYQVIPHACAYLAEHVDSDLADAIVSPTCESIDLERVDAEGNRHWLHVMTHFVTDDNNRPLSVIGKIIDTSDVMREKLDLSDRAHHDGLTGLLNWKTFKEEAGLLLEQGHAGALLVVDTDDFKLVNDTYGHLSGDSALQCTAAALRDAFRPHDLVGRLGGDEFAICINGPINAKNLAKRCAGMVESGVTFYDQDGNQHIITISVGGVELHGCSTTYQEAYRQADQALYHAKADGKDRFVIEKLS